MECFKTTGTLNESMVREVNTCMLSKEQRYTLIGCIIIFALLFMYCIARRYEILGAVVFTSAIFLVYYYTYVLKKQSLKLNIARLREISGAEGYQMSTWFDHTGINIQNYMTNATSKIQAVHFRRVAETENLYIIFTKANQYMLVFKNCLDEAQRKLFIAFLKENFPNLQYELKRKK